LSKDQVIKRFWKKIRIGESAVWKEFMPCRNVQESEKVFEEPWWGRDSLTRFGPPLRRVVHRK